MDRAQLVAFAALTLACMPVGAKDCTRHAYAAIAADVVSSEVAIHNGAHEQNPLLGDGDTATLAASALIRTAIVWALDRTDTRANCYVAAFTYGVAANNVAVAAGASDAEAIAIGIGVSIPFWDR